MKYAVLQAETSGIRGAQKQTTTKSPTPFVGFNEKDEDDVLIDGDDGTNPLNLPLTFPKDWDGFVEDRKTSPQPPPYDCVGSLSIISTPMIKDGSLRDESQMKELLSDILTDPSVISRRRTLDTPSTSSGTGPSSSSARRSSSPNNPPVLPARRSTVSSTAPILPLPRSSRPTEPPSQPDVPLWTRKRSLRPAPHDHDMKGGVAGTVVTRSLSASEAE